MAVISVEETRKPRGNETVTERNYTRNFQVRTDSPDDGPVTVLADSRLPQVGEVYAYGTERDDFALVRTRQYDQDPRIKTLHLVQCNYSTNGTYAGLTPGEPQEPVFIPNPLNRPVTLAFSQITEDVPWEKAIDYTNPQSPVETPILNSASQPFEPQPTKPKTIDVITFTKNVATFDLSWMPLYRNTVNADVFFGVARGYAKMASIIPQEREESGISYVQVSYEVQFNDQNWALFEPLDQGFVTKGPNDTWEVAKDLNNLTFGQPVLLDGNGKQLAQGGTPQYLSFDWRYRYADWSVLGIG